MIALILLLAGSPQTVPPPPKAAASDQAATPSPEALAAARRVIVASDLQNQYRTLLPQMLDAALAQTHAMFKASAVPEGLEIRLRDVMKRELASMAAVYTPEVIDRLAEAYARHLSASDLNHVAELLSDPAMVRFRERQPAIMAEVMPVLLEVMAPRQAAFQKALVRVIADWIREHPADKARLAKPLAT